VKERASDGVRELYMYVYICVNIYIVIYVYICVNIYIVKERASDGVRERAQPD